MFLIGVALGLLFLMVAPLAPPPALLVLRTACFPPRPELFEERRLRNYAAITGRALLLNRTIDILSYEETCMMVWLEPVTRAVLGAVAAGGSVVCAGCGGSALCTALDAAVRVLHRPIALSCREQGARASAVRHLAQRLQWRHALIPQLPVSWSSLDDCGSALKETAVALESADVHLHSDVSALITRALRPHVVISCASSPASHLRRREAAAVRRELVEALWSLRASVETLQRAHVIVLLLQPRPSVTSPIYPSQNIIPNSNITLALLSLPLVGNEEKLASRVRKRYRIESRKNIPTSSPAFRDKRYLKKSDSNNTFTETRQYSTNIYVRDKSKASDVSRGIKNNKHRQRGIQSTWTQGTVRERRELMNKGEDYHDRNSLEDILTQFGSTFIPLLLKDTSFDLDVNKTEIELAYEEILLALERESDAEQTGIETSKMNFVLYEGSHEKLEYYWRPVTTIQTTIKRDLEKNVESTTVNTKHPDERFERWISEHVASEEEKNGWVIITAVVAGGTAVAVTATVAMARGVVAYCRRRRRGSVVLVASEFVFPANERRRLGEGMETMLSCWLQQLHEFGGPDLEQPDLLKRPPLAPPSVPSSTCSVNRLLQDRRIRYKGDAVHLKALDAGVLELKSGATDVLLIMQSLRHENINPFIGCLCELRPSLVWDYCGRGSLEDVLMADEIKLDWTFRLSLLTDLVKGMRYLHASALRIHGRLTSRNCVVDSRWVLRVTDYGLPGFHRTQGLPLPHSTPRDLLWSAPEVLRDVEVNGAHRGPAHFTQPADVFSFAIIMQEVIVRGEPYCMLSLTPEEIVEKLRRPPPLIRPSVSMSAAPPEAVSVMRQCWAEPPELRPDFARLHEIFRHLHRGRKINIVDSMFEMLEKYSNNLEELIRERTEQLDIEKKKTEQLLNRMLPRSVAERLVAGVRVQPEEFEEVSIYFSDIVGFTALAARSTPVQVVDMLNDLYTTFDAAIEQYQVYKVETIGDAYMVVGGLPTRTASHAENVANMALHLLHLAGRFRIRHLPATPLHLRIGLHTGPCCAGVVGLTMPRYCLFGDTVNTASRMESTGAAWRIQVSTATAERLTAAGGYRLRSRGLVQVKGKGAMHTYWLLGKEGFDKPLPTPPPLQSEEVLFETDAENEMCVSETAASSSTAADEQQQRLEPSPLTNRIHAWQRSGAVSADSSPPPPASLNDLRAPYSVYRCLQAGGGARSRSRALRRQWSLERDDTLAAAAAEDGGGSVSALRTSVTSREPLALLAIPTARSLEPRYRTRVDTPLSASSFFALPTLSPLHNRHYDEQNSRPP